MQNGLQRALADLRASFAESLVDDEPTQVLLFEAWVKREQWRLREEALPLLVGTDPAVWQASPQSPLVREAGDRLAVALAARLQLEPDTDAHVTPLAFRAAAEALMLDLPPALARLLDFLARVLSFQQADTASASAQGLADAVGASTVPPEADHVRKIGAERVQGEQRLRHVGTCKRRLRGRGLDPVRKAVKQAPTLVGCASVPVRTERNVCPQ